MIIIPDSTLLKNGSPFMTKGENSLSIAIGIKSQLVIIDCKQHEYGTVLTMKNGKSYLIVNSQTRMLSDIKTRSESKKLPKPLCA